MNFYSKKPEDPDAAGSSLKSMRRANALELARIVARLEDISYQTASEVSRNDTVEMFLIAAGLEKLIEKLGGPSRSFGDTGVSPTGHPGSMRSS